MGKHWTIHAILLVVVATLAAATPLVATPALQTQTEQASQEHDNVSQGVLSRVDTESQKFWIKGQNGEEIEFQYDSKTQVEGAAEGVQGLASETGTRLRVHFVAKSDQKLATKIEMIKE